ncbi:hypothetical protein GQX74_005055 [Glossina fuscipes]|nr:hypothetical protein GQX74_005055 [Glossina fuscipes]
MILDPGVAQNNLFAFYAIKKKYPWVTVRSHSPIEGCHLVKRRIFVWLTETTIIEIHLFIYVFLIKEKL